MTEATETTLTPREVGAILRLTSESVKAIPSTDLPFFRANARGDRRYLRADVEAYIARRRVG